MMYPNIPKMKHLDTGNFFLIAGPCVVEDKVVPFEIVEHLVEVTERLQIPFAFKASYRKANRSRVDSFTGIGDWEALELLSEIGKKYNVPIVTDIHNEVEAEMAAQFVDVLQIPAFLCRQTSLLQAAAQTGKVVNIKKGQFLSPEAMKHAVDKVRYFGGKDIMITERGTTFGYQDLVVDFRGIPIMKQNDVPVVMDITHSLQKPNQPAGVTGGNPELIGIMGRAAVAVGVDGIFLETHPYPLYAKSDGANMLRMDFVEDVLKRLLVIHKAANSVIE